MCQIVPVFALFLTHFSMEILVIQEIKEIQQILQLKFRLRMTWFDARLDFFNIKLDENMNVISIDDDTHTLYKYMSIFHVPEIV